MNYKVGDVVFVKDETFFLNHPNHVIHHFIVVDSLGKYCFNKCMLDFHNKLITIDVVHNTGYNIIEDNGDYTWQDWMLVSRNEKLEKMLK